MPTLQAQASGVALPSAKLAEATQGMVRNHNVTADQAKVLRAWLRAALPWVEEDNARETARLETLNTKLDAAEARDTVLATLSKRRPVFVLFSNYFRSGRSSISPTSPNGSKATCSTTSSTTTATSACSNCSASARRTYPISAAPRIRIQTTRTSSRPTGTSSTAAATS